ncbi:ATP-binding cassette domain-containing protein [Pseudonocardiaceae bacterium YIM PH 21723]|nr:ATP-binding cassette domain-containing protein [Pseudonocardiaceae bacterium YIM PH 21723]
MACGSPRGPRPPPAPCSVPAPGCVPTPPRRRSPSPHGTGERHEPLQESRDNGSTSGGRVVPVLSAHGLGKQYEGRQVVSDVSFVLREGTVTAFLGPNGAGKSTTLRMITGLTEPSAGMATIAGRPYVRWANPSHAAGVLLDGAAVRPGLSGRKHLQIAALQSGVARSRVDTVLEMVDLASAAGRRISKYSLGMRQRLGLAHALLADPPMLILDEPINGLDPGGIRSVRLLLREYAQRGGTVLLSSHVLSEVDQTADRVLVIGGGRILADGPLTELTRSGRTLVRATDMRHLMRVLERDRIRYEQRSDGRLAVYATPERISPLAQAEGLPLTELASDNSALEELFFKLTGPQQTQDGAGR